MPNSKTTHHDPWSPLRSHTAARIALGRAGGSLPTAELLDFRAAHASAVDAVYAPLDVAALQSDLVSLGQETLVLHSSAPDRATYLARPDLGRQLDEQSRGKLLERSTELGRSDIALIIADGLSAKAAQRQAPPLLRVLMPRLQSKGLSIAPIVIVRHGRVAIQDEIGQILNAKMACILLGERPGLGTPDSLGAYLVHGPKSGNTNAQRNCVSNIRPEGLSFDAAADLLAYLITHALHLGISGIDLKDERVNVSLPSSTSQVLP